MRKFVYVPFRVSCVEMKGGVCWCGPREGWGLWQQQEPLDLAVLCCLPIALPGHCCSSLPLAAFSGFVLLYATQELVANIFLGVGSEGRERRAGRGNFGEVFSDLGWSWPRCCQTLAPWQRGARWCARPRPGDGETWGARRSNLLLLKRLHPNDPGCMLPLQVTSASLI